MIKELVLKNRSYRSFSPAREITSEEVTDMIKCARITPSAMNLQPLRYRICVTKEDREALFPLTAWAGKLKDIKLPPKGHEPRAYIVMCTDNTIVDSPKAAWRDVGICAQTILLRAAEMGLGGCMLGAFSAEKVSKALSIDEKYSPALIIALGEPDEEIILEDANGDVSYYRDESGVHRVPKRKLEDVII